MASIETQQSNLLLNNKEQISYKVFDSEGVFLRTEDENILVKTPIDLQNINSDLVIERERPLKKVEFITDLEPLNFKNENANFINGSAKFIIATPQAGKTSDVRSDAAETVDALTGGKYFFSQDNATNASGFVDALISIDKQHNTISQGKKLKVGFNYHIKTTDDTEKYIFKVEVGLDESYSSGTDLKRYAFQDKQWKDAGSVTGLNRYRTVNTETVNNWGKVQFEIEPYDSASVTTDVFVNVRINRPFLKSASSGATGNFQAIYIDNFFIAETNDIDSDLLISRRKQVPANGNFSGEYLNEENTISNAAKTTDYFIGKYDGTFKRLRDNTAKSMEQIVTIEQMNDYRNYLSRYTGTFCNKSTKHIGLHNKVHIDFGGETYQDPVSCYIDGMTYDVKAAYYDMRLHLPNQDNDVDTTFVNVFD